MNSWQLLGLAPTSDTQAIRRAYALKIRTYRPDTHPKEFSDIRTAYEMALREAAWYAEEEEYTEDENDVHEIDIADGAAQASTNVEEKSRPNPEILVFNTSDIGNLPIDQNEAIPTPPPPIEELVLPDSQHFSTPPLPLASGDEQAAESEEREETFSIGMAISRLDELHSQGDVAGLLACFTAQQQELANASIDLRMDYAETLAYFLAYSRELAPELLFQASAVLQWRQAQQHRLGLHEVSHNPSVNASLLHRLDVADMGIAAAYFSPNALLNAQLRPENPPSRRWAWGVDWQRCRHFLGGLQQECSRRDVAPAQHWRFPEHKNSALHQFGLILSTDILLGLFLGTPFGLWLDNWLGRPSDFSFLLCWAVGWLLASALPSLARYAFSRAPSWLRYYFPNTGLKQYFGGLFGFMLALGMSAVAEESRNFLPFAVFAYLLLAPCALFAAACWGTLAWRILVAGETLAYLVFVHWWRAWSASLAFPLAQKTGSLDHRLKPPPVASWRQSWRARLRIFWLLWRKGWHVYVRNPGDISPNFHHRSTQKTAEKESSNSWWGWFLLLILLTNFFRALTGK